MGVGVGMVGDRTVEGVCQRSGSGFVDDAEDLEASNLAGVLGHHFP